MANMLMYADKMPNKLRLIFKEIINNNDNGTVLFTL